VPLRVWVLRTVSRRIKPETVFGALSRGRALNSPRSTGCVAAVIHTVSDERTADGGFPRSVQDAGQ
jgi:hypothetical protein